MENDDKNSQKPLPSEEDRKKLIRKIEKKEKQLEELKKQDPNNEEKIKPLETQIKKLKITLQHTYGQTYEEAKDKESKPESTKSSKQGKPQESKTRQEKDRSSKPEAKTNPKQEKPQKANPEQEKAKQAQESDNAKEEGAKTGNPVSLEKGIAKADIVKRMQEYEEIRIEDLDITLEEDRKEFNRINNVMSTLQGLLDRNLNSAFVSMEDINGMIYYNKQKIKDIWEQVMNSGEGATPQEEAMLQKIKDIIKELEDISQLKTKENDTKQEKAEQAQESDNAKEEDAKTRNPVSLEKGIAKADIVKRMQEYEEMRTEGLDIRVEEDRKELNRINNVMSTLQELLNKNPNSAFVSMEDINGIIYDNKQKTKDLWEQVMNSGESATPQEEAMLKQMDDVVKELEDILQLKTKEDSSKQKETEPEQEDKNSNKQPKPEAKEGSGYAEGGFQPPAVVDPNKEFQPPVLKFPTLDLDINKKTGKVILTEKGATQKYYTTYMNAEEYSKERLKFWKTVIQSKQDIAEGDKRYLDAVDPTIYNAYLNWDRENAEKYCRSAARMYVESVITRAKNLENGYDLEDVEMPGKIDVDIGWHRKKDERPEGVQGFKKLKNLVASFRANKILKNHNPKNMDLAQVKDNRWKFGATITALLAGAGIGAVALTQGNPQKGAPEEIINGIEGVENPGVDFDKDIAKTLDARDKKDEKDNKDKKDEKAKDETQNQGQDKQEKSNRIYPGDIIIPEQYAMTFNSSDAKVPDGSIGNINQAYGVNKMSVIIGDKMYTTDKYSADELYAMAESNPNASIKWHMDKAIEMDGKMVVETHEVGNPSPIYIYNDNGVTKTSDGREWNGDVEYGFGWVDNEKLTKAQQTQDKQQPQSNTQQQRVQEEELER